MTRLRVLVVDDTLDRATTACDAVASLGHDSRPATTLGVAREALAFLPAVVIVRLVRPWPEGFAIASTLRTCLAGLPIYLMAIAEWDYPEFDHGALDTGFDSHVVSPLEPDTFARILALAARFLATAGEKRPTMRY